MRTPFSCLIPFCFHSSRYNSKSDKMINKITKSIFFLLLFAILSYYGYFFFNIMRYKHSFNLETPKEYLWLFQDSVKNDILSTSSYSLVRKKGVYNHYIFKNDRRVIIWEFKDLPRVNLSSIKIRKDANLTGNLIDSGEKLNKGSNPEISVKFGDSMSSGFSVNLDKRSDVTQCCEEENYIGFAGVIHKMAFFNLEGVPQIVFKYRGDQIFSTVVLYKKGDSLYLLIVKSSKEALQADIRNIFDLE